MVDEERDTISLVRIDNSNEQRDPQAILQTNLSTISFNNLNVSSKDVIDILDKIYSDRTHRRCISISYFTLLSMTLAISSWMFHWIADNRCQNTDDPEYERFLCDLGTTLEILTYSLVGTTPFLFILMIFLWIRYSCHNPMDSIREDSQLFKIEGDQWYEQLNYYYTKKKLRCLNCFRRKQRRELHDRGYGYVILSSHGIVLDELIIFSAQKNIIDNGVLSDNNKLLKLTFKKTCTRPWKEHISIYLPEDVNNRHGIEKLTQLLKIQINSDTGISASF